MTEYEKRALPAQSEGGVVAPHENDLDPIAVLTAAIDDDPSLAELVAFRACKPDLKSAARESKRLHDESLRIRFSELENRWQVAAGLTLASLSYMAAVCIWPTDTLDEADAKLALGEATRIHGDRQEADYVATIENALARRIRVQRAAFSVGELMVPPAPQAPGPEARGLASWPLQRLDLKTMLPSRGGPPNSPIARWNVGAVSWRRRRTSITLLTESSVSSPRRIGSWRCCNAKARAAWTCGALRKAPC